ncbi:MAG: glycosyltransferase family 8 protein [Treponema sp.]|nr:glycosyltransferase family 8 protein [Treponema sp.]
MANTKESKKRIAIVSPLYGTDLSNNISLQCNSLLAELKNDFDIIILTTCATEDASWRNEYPDGEQFIDSVRVIRFPVKHERQNKNYSGFRRFLYKEWIPNTEEVRWFVEQGPFALDLCTYLHTNYSAFDVVLFLDCISYTTAVCMLEIPNALLMPIVQNQEILPIFHFRKVFTQPVGFIFQDQKEQNLIYSIFPDSKEKPCIVSGSKNELCNLINKVDFIRTKKISDTYHSDTYINRKIQPAFSKDNIAVVFSSDDRYVYILSVALQSLIDKTSTSWNYDICIISDGIQNKKKEILRLICSGRHNVSLRFIEISHLLDCFTLNTFNKRLSRTTFGRLYIPELFSEYSKVLSLDGDIIIKKDISELYNTEIDNYYLAAIPDIGVLQLFKYRKADFDYLKSIGFSDMDKYFNAGVILFNINEIKRNYSVAKMVEMVTVNKFHFDEQDAFNCYAKNHVKFLKLNWNMFWQENDVDQNILMLSSEYREAYNTPYILHYTGGILPTSFNNSRFASDFWKVAQKTPCYESVLNIAINNYNKPVEHKNIGKKKKVFLRRLNSRLRKEGFIKTINYYCYRLKFSSYFKNN